MKTPVSGRSIEHSAVPWRVLALYNLPAIGFGYIYMLFGLYVVKFSTDVLLIAPAVVGTIFGISRLWDMFNDPIVGYFSDRTRWRMGRRRPWILASALPITIGFTMTFAPPAMLSSASLSMWLGIAILTTFTGMSLFAVPHMSLGAELTHDHHERNRFFGFRFAALTSGYVLGLAGIWLLVDAEATGIHAARQVALNQAVVASGVMGGMLIIAASFLRERGVGSERSTVSALQAIRDVRVNPHARLVLAATFADNLGMAVSGALTLYIAEYVVGDAKLGVLLLVIWLAMSLISVPIWIRLTQRYGKRNGWIAAQILAALSYGGMIFLNEGAVILFLAIGFLAGTAAGCGGTVALSLQSDVIDYDELLTGERKEGVYFAAWNLAVKLANGVTVLIIGVTLQLAGFQPNAVQTPTVKFVLVAVSSGFPLAFYIMGVVLLSRYSLNEREHMAVRRALDIKRAGRGEGALEFE